MTTLQELLNTGETIVADGGMGSLLIARGLTSGTAPELWNIEKPEVIRQIHADYIQAGAQIILTNSFGGTRLRLDMHGLGERTEELNQAAARLARQEADSAPHPVVVGGSISQTGQFLEPLGTLKFEDAVAVYAEQARALIAGGVDVLWIETMADLQEVKAAVAGCREAQVDFPIVTTMTFDSNGRTMMGITPEQAINTLADMNVVALGGNCGNGPEEIIEVINKMRATNPDVILIAKANAGKPKMVDGAVTYDATPEDMGVYAQHVLDKGARIIGSCCGSTPAHVKAIAQALKG